MSIPSTDLENLVFGIFGNCRRQLNFAVVFRVNEGKYQNKWLTPILTNSHAACKVVIVK